MLVFIISGIVIAVTCAVRGLWSPCGLSMVSTITPLSERSRGHRFWATATWFVIGGLVGGLTIGAAAALAAALVALTGAGIAVRASLLGVTALVTIASDLGVGGFRLPVHPRQVNETWLAQYRSWAYASGFGWQIGVGVATYIMTAGVYLVIAVGVLSASPLIAVSTGALFGVVRGLCVLVAARATTPARLRNLHGALARHEPASRALALIGQAVVGASALTVAPLAIGLVCFGVGIVLVVAAFVLPTASNVCVVEATPVTR